MKCIVEIHCEGQQHLVVRKNERECMTPSSAYHGDAPDYKFMRLSAAELCDFGCFVILACGVILLGQTDISLIYHMIRGQGTIKLYVVYNVLEIFDKLCQNFGGDVFQTLFNSAEGLANCSQENMRFWIRRFVSDQALAMAFSNILIFKQCFPSLPLFNPHCFLNILVLFVSLTIITSSFFYFISSGNYVINLHCRS
ncbi:hypothetical protein F3Y22_tig00110893pilonHSYRG00753 [Hibiscus syriacus]|uniref:Uncharacterized protein n=1 Tax=Hibiscus syriacus TaxID=106335 RepID=A0A6A2ZHV7_HIBSY|nr:hypothetical protein F3Y22_tig00110893pilonHSYRG00753 [Hibiscus syriacus]